MKTNRETKSSRKLNRKSCYIKMILIFLIHFFDSPFLQWNKPKSKIITKKRVLYTYPEVFRSTFENQSSVDLRDNIKLRYIPLRHKVLTSIWKLGFSLFKLELSLRINNRCSFPWKFLNAITSQFFVDIARQIFIATQWQNYFRVEDLLQKKRKTKTEKKWTSSQMDVKNEEQKSYIETSWTESKLLLLVSINDLSESFSSATRSTKEKFGKVESLRL